MKKSKKNNQMKEIDVTYGFKRNWQLYLMLVLPILYFIIFKYYPMYGAQIAFRKYRASDGILGSEWVGLTYFIKFLESKNCWEVIRNTLSISISNLVWGFPVPIILALALHTSTSKILKKTVQFMVYVPHFISVVVMSGVVIQFLNIRFGIINKIIVAFGGTATDFLSNPSMFNEVFVWSGIWQNAGWGTIVYLAALINIDPTFHEAARVDGANRFKRIWYIDIPGILPTIMTMLILNCGQILNVGWQKVLLLQNSLNLEASEVIQTYTYKIGLASGMADFSYSTAIGLFTSICNLIIVVSVNQIAKKVNDSGIW